MIHCLIATDFSPASAFAVNYGTALAARLEASVHLIHMIHLDTFTHAPASVHMQLIVEKMTEIAMKNLHAIQEDIRQKFSSIKIKTACIHGQVLSESLKSYVNENGIDLIIMGTHGASGIIGKLLGSNASNVIASSPVPVLVIPPGTEYRSHPRIFLTTDLNNLEPKLKMVAPLAFFLKSELTLLHISVDDSHTPDEEEELGKRLRKEFNLPALKVKIIRHPSVYQGILEYARAHQPCIVAMFTHKPGFMEKLLGKSVTRHVVFHLEVPLLAFKV
jgi:nucleotide-binding universal stress UspA family protein